MMKDLSVHGESLALDIDKTSMSLQVKGDDVNSKVTVKERASKKLRDLEDQIQKTEDEVEAEKVYKNMHSKHQAAPKSFLKLQINDVFDS